MGPLPELSHLYTAEQAANYPQMTAYEILMQELSATGMVFDVENPVKLTMWEIRNNNLRLRHHWMMILFKILILWI